MYITNTELKYSYFLRKYNLCKKIVSFYFFKKTKYQKLDVFEVCELFGKKKKRIHNKNHIYTSEVDLSNESLFVTTDKLFEKLFIKINYPSLIIILISYIKIS